MSEITSPPTPVQPRRDRTWVIVVSIVLGIILACAILPLGGMALLLMFDGGSSAATVPAADGRKKSFPVAGRIGLL